MTLRDRLLALLVVVIWGMNFVIIKYGLQGMPPFLLAGLRFLLVVFPAILFVPRPKLPWKWLVLYGLTMSFGQFAFLFCAIKVGMPAGLASLVLQAQVFFTLLLGMLVFAERLRIHHVIGIVVATMGMLFLAQASLQTKGASAVPLAGLLLTLGAAFSWAIGNLTNKKIMATFPQQGILPLVVWSALIPIVPFFVCSGLFDGRQQVLDSLLNLQIGSVGVIVYLSFAATLLGYSIWGNLLARYETWRVAPLALLVPLVGLVSAWLLMDEALSWLQVSGALLVLVGMTVNTFGLPCRGMTTRK
ncbi:MULTISPECIES: EamA family transporter [unclassified Serratia (in: enterobacteria)]|uniref:EamA family transporter n=1 Tax=unclassified Serratia (in: enterobacteria) TaxID=2647522 RepID=UPI0005083025|nr:MULTISPECIES: EamA family transporter [unclassified Serratia (in: enterobacteria)]KFK95549.1 acetylserine transporter [Serratia sp. Ag2]KFL00437.1 acetylserine transporter [Serratia sp. Ag1]